MAKQTENAVLKKHPNEGIGLDTFNYSYDTMREENYNTYLDIVEGKQLNPKDYRSPRTGGLNAHKKYVFECYDVRPIMEEVYPGMKDSPRKCVGFNLVNSKPKVTTTTFLKDVLLLNQSLTSFIGGGGNNPVILYYLLQKPTQNA